MSAYVGTIASSDGGSLSMTLVHPDYPQLLPPHLLKAWMVVSFPVLATANYPFDLTALLVSR